MMYQLTETTRRRLPPWAAFGLATKLKAQERSAAHSADTAMTQIARYVTDVAEAGTAVNAVEF